jgi:hypothetical protein
MEKIGTGPKLPPSAPSKFGLYSAPTPTITVQSPDADGGKGTSKGGAGRVKAVWATAGLDEDRAEGGENCGRGGSALSFSRIGAANDWYVRLHGSPSLPSRERPTRVVRGSYLTGEHCRKIASAEAAGRMPEGPRRHAHRRLAFFKPVAVIGKNERPARPMMRV